MKIKLEKSMLKECVKHALDEIDSTFAACRLYTSTATGVAKEEVIIDVLKSYNINLNWIMTEHGWDAYDDLGQNYEIKSEAVGTTSKLGGKITLSKTNNDLKFERFLKDRPLIILSGWTRNGKLVYIATMPFESTGLMEAEKKRSNANTSLKISMHHHKNLNLINLVYLNVNLCGSDTCTRDFRTWLERRYIHNKTFINESIKYSRLF